ncbi:MAG: ATP-dependent RNA helicase HrpA [Deltaproteobacteria bacterium]|nr:ATP-dependent RNA helicase HrpA [Deltaproteobacteria bacterium]
MRFSTDLYGGPEGPLSISYPQDLPILEKREEILQALATRQVVVVVGETGSGKSTQIPKMCLEAGRGSRGLIGCTQPRRIAAVALAARVAEELGEQGPKLVGHKIRFQDRTARTNRIKFMTDGILLAEVQRDDAFRAYDTLIIDEAHERTLNIDFLLGLVKRVLPGRPDLKVVITSATIDPEKFSRAFDGAPIIEVSGRMYPVEVWYRPPDETDPEGEDRTAADHAIDAVNALRSAGGGRLGRGDVLIFMPTESDIRETVQRLEDMSYPDAVVLPLFGRMAAADQQRVFSAVSRQKIIVSTNIAETSLTIPGIRYVIDTGLARISAYNARSRTQGLPVMPISRASADQRKGRCGRMEAGICIRLYSEQDYLSRPLYTSPEIQRSNLAEVILRMLYLKLGNIQDFPFLDPPAPAAVKDAFAALRELRAVDEHRRITSLGRMMARFPLDPRLARMLLEARKENCVHEMVILASALSVQDPRERPLEHEARADQVHAAFRDSRSDFVTLLKIWHACWPGWSPEGNARPKGEDGFGGEPEPGSSSPVPPSRSRLKKFCRDHFLSYRRIREWKDVYEEISSILDELGGFHPNPSPAGYENIHRAVLSGYLSHIALRKEKNIYMAARNRQVMLFPGSGLFNRGSAWIVASELVQTSRLFARMAAAVEPEWLESLGGHLCRRSYSEPHWEKKRGQVVAFERVTLYGLPIVERRPIAYDRIKPAEAREIFIRAALVEGEILGRYAFLEHNRWLIRHIEELESRTRRRDLMVDEETVYAFYDSRLPSFSDSRTLDRFIREQGGDALLRMKEEDLLRVMPDRDELSRFPESLEWDEFKFPLRYVFQPGSEEDGVTVRIPVHLLPRLESAFFRWLVPGLLPEKVTALLRGLPKNIRRLLVPLNETVEKVVSRLRHRQGDLYHQLTGCVRELSGFIVPPEAWEAIDIPIHLRMRFEIVGVGGNILGSGRDLERLRSLASRRYEDALWKKAQVDWELEGLTSWEFGDLPTQVELGVDSIGMRRRAWLGLSAESKGVAVRLFSDPASAMAATRAGLMLLYEFTLGSELRQVARGWAIPENMASTVFFMGARGDAGALLQIYIKRELFDLSEPQWPDRRKFERTVESLRGRLHAAGREMVEEVLKVLQAREAARANIVRFHRSTKGNPSVQRCMERILRELEALVPPDFLQRYRRSRVQQLPRYLRAVQLRAERAYAAPEKDALKARQVAVHQERYEKLLEASEKSDPETGAFLEEFHWMIEEFKISVFAPEIKTLYRISEKRLDEKWRQWQLRVKTVS